MSKAVKRETEDETPPAAVEVELTPEEEAAVADWTEKISFGWKRTVEVVIQTGKLLSEARAGLSQHQWGKLLSKLPFQAGEAWKLMRIANHRGIALFLPQQLPTVSILGELAAIDADDFVAGVRAGVITSETTVKAARAYRRALETPAGEKVQAGKKVSMLPSPKEAQQIAAVTDRIVAASDGKLYTGASETETTEHIRRRTETYAVIDAIKTLAKQGPAPRWIEQAEPYWLSELELWDVDAAGSWLDTLTQLLQKRAEENGQIVQGKVANA